MSTLNKISEIISLVNPEQDVLYKKWNIQHRDEYFTQVYWSYHPITDKYFFEGNPAFSYEYKNLFDFGRYPVTMLRDGFVGILEFFLIHPKPTSDFKSIILIPERFQKLVPKTWEGQVACYKIIPRNNSNSHQANFLMVHGLPTEELFLNQTVEDIAKEIKGYVEGYEDYFIYLPIRDSLLSKNEVREKVLYIELLKEIYRHVGFEAKVEFHKIQNILRLLETKKFDFINLDQDRFFVNDNYIDHHLYSIGGKNLKPDSVSDGESLRYNLSKNHSVEITECRIEDKCFSEFFYYFKISGQKLRSIYEVFKDDKIRELHSKHFLDSKS